MSTILSKLTIEEHGLRIHRFLGPLKTPVSSFLEHIIFNKKKTYEGKTQTVKDYFLSENYIPIN